MNEPKSHEPTAAFEPATGSEIARLSTLSIDASNANPEDNTESDDAGESGHSSPTDSSPVQWANIPGLKVMEEVARGGMGVVLRAHDTTLRRDVALKVLLDRPSKSSEFVRRFEEEAQIGGQLQHPGIVPVYAFGRSADQRPYFTMKLVKGLTLTKLLSNRSNPADDRPRFLKIFEQLCQALAYAHSKGVIHRDLKPSNVMVGNFGEVQVMDWGLAKVLDPKASSKVPDMPVQGSTVIRTVRSSPTGTVTLDDAGTQSGTVLGTPNFMSPEQAVGNMETLDARTDVFSLGSILCNLLTGRPAYVGSDANTIYLKALQADLEEAFAALDACKLDDELVELTKKCLSPKAKDRPKDAGELAAEFTGYLDSVESRLRAEQLARIEAQTNEISERKRRKTQLTLSAAAGVFLLAGIAGTLWYASDARRERDNARQAELVAKNAEAAAAKERDNAREAESVAKKAEAAAATERDKARQAESVAKKAEAAAATERDKAREAESDARLYGEFLAEHIGAPSPENFPGGQGIDVSMREALENAEEKIPIKFKGRERAEAQVRHAIGKSWRNLGRYPEAQANFRRAVELREKHLGPNDDETMESRIALSTILLKSPGTVVQAIALLEPMRDYFAGQHAPVKDATKPVAVLNNLALAYKNQKRTKEAIAAFEQLRDIQANALAQGNPDALVALANLGSAYLDDKQIAKAIECLDHAAKGLGNALGPDDARTLSANNSLANAYRLANQREKAVALWELVAEARRRLQGSDHRDTLITLRNLAITYSELGQNDRAFVLFEEVRKHRVAREPNNPATMFTLNDLSARYQKAGKLLEAAQVLAELGGIQLHGGETSAAARTLGKCLQLRRQLKLDDWETGRLRIQLGEALLADKKQVEGEAELIAGYADLKRHAAKAPADRNAVLTHVLDLLTCCAEANKQPQRAQQWRAEKATLQTKP